MRPFTRLPSHPSVGSPSPQLKKRKEEAKDAEALRSRTQARRAAASHPTPHLLPSHLLPAHRIVSHASLPLAQAGGGGADGEGDFDARMREQARRRQQMAAARDGGGDGEVRQPPPPPPRPPPPPAAPAADGSGSGGGGGKGDGGGRETGWKWRGKAMPGEKDSDEDSDSDEGGGGGGGGGGSGMSALEARRAAFLQKKHASSGLSKRQRQEATLHKLKGFKSTLAADAPGSESWKAHALHFSKEKLEASAPPPPTHSPTPRLCPSHRIYHLPSRLISAPCSAQAESASQYDSHDPLKHGTDGGRATAKIKEREKVAMSMKRGFDDED